MAAPGAGVEQIDVQAPAVDVDPQRRVAAQGALALDQTFELRRPGDHSLAPVPREQQAVAVRGHGLQRDAVVAARPRQGADQAPVEILADGLMEDATGAQRHRAARVGSGLAGQRQGEFVEVAAEQEASGLARPRLPPIVGAIQARPRDPGIRIKGWLFLLGGGRRVQVCEIGIGGRRSAGGQRTQQ